MFFQLWQSECLTKVRSQPADGVRQNGLAFALSTVGLGIKSGIKNSSRPVRPAAICDECLSLCDEILTEELT